MARHEQLTITTDWTELTNADAKALALSITSDNPPQASALMVRFQTADPGASEVGHLLRLEANRLQTFDMEFLGGRAWARALTTAWPVKVYVDTVDA